MIKNIIRSAFILLCFGGVSLLVAQPPANKTMESGEVLSVSPNKIVLQTKDGPINVALSDSTRYLRASPENPSPTAAVPSAFADIGVGDKLLVSGKFSDDKKTVTVRTIYLMSKSDISQKHAKESEKWKTRGISGKVIAVNPATNQISVGIRGLVGSSTLVLTPKGKATFRRYAPDSIRYDEAKNSSLSEIKVGDELRALGDKSADGTSFAAEEVLSGAFQTIAGTVKTIDAEKNEVVITDLQTKKDLIVSLNGALLLKRFPVEQAERLARLQMGGAGVEPRPVGQGSAQTPQGPPAGSPAPTPGGGRAGFGGRAPGGIDEMLPNFPNITAADLKAGDVIAVSSTKNGTTDRIKAIKLLAGVEPFLRLAQASPGGQRGQGVQGGFTIPGLDGVSFP